MEAQSISFDRAADYYDDTRGLPDDIAQKQAETLVAEIERTRAHRVLEDCRGWDRPSDHVPLMTEFSL